MGERTQQPVHGTRGDIRVTTNNAKRQAVPTSLLGDFATVDSVPWAVQDNRVAPGNLEILQKTMCEHPIDPNRVYLSGVSFGGSNCWTMAAGTASLCFGMLDASRLPSLAMVAPLGASMCRANLYALDMAPRTATMQNVSRYAAARTRNRRNEFFRRPRAF